MIKSIRIFASVLLVLLVFSGALDGQMNPENPKFSLTIKASKPEVTLGSDIDIAITTTNLTEKFLTFLFGNQGNVAVGFEYFVLDEKSAPVAKYGTRYLHFPDGQTVEYPKPPGKSMLGGIPPGESSQTGSKISDIYNFDHPGKYTIQVSRKEESSSIPVYSNIITITVLAPPTVADAPK
jgi:hypothetical protein